jgi:hypothetical protein
MRDDAPESARERVHPGDLYCVQRLELGREMHHPPLAVLRGAGIQTFTKAQELD